MWLKPKNIVLLITSCLKATGMGVGCLIAENRKGSLRRYYYFYLTAILGCTSPESEPDTRFIRMSPSETGIDFKNQVDYTEEFNVYTYRNFYNGGGVAIGDINNDGMQDIFFCGNLVDNKLYVNEGDWKFSDISREAGVSSTGVWSTGVSFADVNGDGWLDIYVCKSGAPGGEQRFNELFINNGDLTFTESAEAYGLNDMGLSTHAAFFDYDLDGDLDCYLLNNSFRSIGNYDLRPNQREIRDTEGGNKLYRNEGNRFVDVSEEAGIYGSSIGFGLGVTLGDINLDGWPDIFVSNDFFERDYLYINNQDGTFKESLEQMIGETSLGSMGADIADINNDGWPEIFVTEMLPEGDARMKTTTAFETWDKYQLSVRNGYYRQFTRNVLQLNRKRFTEGSELVAFNEVSRLAGVHATDWSWGALIADFNNDSQKDIFVANGIYKDLTDQDYINFYNDPEVMRMVVREEGGILNLIDEMPSHPVSNYMFQNEGDLTFTNMASAWGLNEPSFSNGSAYGDLDNDGDLDLVVNNVNMEPFIYRNNTTDDDDANYLTVKLRYKDQNPFAIGSKVTVWQDGVKNTSELFPMRGFQSSVDYRLHFGLGEYKDVDSVVVQWPDRTVTRLEDVDANQLLEIRYEGSAHTVPGKIANSIKSIFNTAEHQIPFVHRENPFVDFDRDRLLFFMMSGDGPPVATGDVNGDGLDDVFIGGAKNQQGQLFLQEQDGSWRDSDQPAFKEHEISEDTDAEFADFDNDGDLDLIVASGGNEFPANAGAFRDRIYFNDGTGDFGFDISALPSGIFESTSTVALSDYDGDGDIDVFAGTRLRPFFYGIPANSYLLENQGDGKFKDVTDAISPGLRKVGMVTSACWADFNLDGKPDLSVAGEFMPLSVFLQETDGTFTDQTVSMGLNSTNGWWNVIAADDIDNDGDVDIVAGNYGLNSRIKASKDKPVELYINDFDGNGTIEQILTTYNGDRSYPLVLRHDMVMQMPGLKRKYLKYANYKEQTMADIFSEDQIQSSIRLESYELRSSIFINNGDHTFVARPLPTEAQFSPVMAIEIFDFDGDGIKDILLGGNHYRIKPEIGIHDGSYGLVLKGVGDARFIPLSIMESGVYIKGEIRDISIFKGQNRRYVLVSRSDESPVLLTY